MNEERLSKILVGVHVSEKAEMSGQENKQIVFKVNRSANKLEVKNAVELFFKVKVKAVNILNVKGKQKRFAQRIGNRKNWKKAYVALMDGFDINFAGVE